MRLHLVPFFGPYTLAAISTELIDQFQVEQSNVVRPSPDPAKVQRGYPPKTITNRLSVLSGLLDLAERRKHIAKAPTINWPELSEPPPRFYTFEEADRLIEAAKVEVFWTSMVLVGLRCGLRLGELRALEWRHVDFRNEIIRVEQTWTKRNATRPDGSRHVEEVLDLPKNRTVRNVPMSPAVVAALKAHVHRLGVPWVWPSDDGDNLKENETKWPMWRACKRAGLPQDGWHILRHSFCSHLVQRGVHLLAVRDLAGHRELKSTLRYAHLAPSVHKSAAAELDKPAPGEGAAVASGDRDAGSR